MAEAHGDSHRFFGKNVALLVTDMSGFTRLVKKRGVIHFSSLILRMRSICMPIMRNNGALLINTEADNLLVVFPSVNQAVTAAVEASKALSQFNSTISAERADWRPIFGGMGIGAGTDVLVTSENKPFGAAFDDAFELGENRSEGGSILLTASAYNKLGEEVDISSVGTFEEKPWEGNDEPWYHYTPAEGFGVPAADRNTDYSEFVSEELEIFLRRNEITDDAAIQSADAEINGKFSRKAATVMWGVEYAHINKAHGPEFALTVQEKVNEIIKSNMEKNNGTLSGIVYLYPTEKDALTAMINTKKEILEAFSGEEESKRPVLKGAGLHSGDVLYVEGTDILFGDAINTAAKLGEDYARDGAICTSAEVHAHVAGLFPDLSFSDEIEADFGALKIKCFTVL